MCVEDLDECNKKKLDENAKKGENFENHGTFEANPERAVPDMHPKMPLYARAHFREQNISFAEDLHYGSKKNLMKIQKKAKM